MRTKTDKVMKSTTPQIFESRKSFEEERGKNQLFKAHLYLQLTDYPMDLEIWKSIRVWDKKNNAFSYSCLLIWGEY